MSDVAEDISEALAEVGQEYVIIRSGEVSPAAEFCYSQLNRQVTKPFTREFFREATLPYDTEADAGDVLHFVTLDEYFMVMNKTGNVFENEIIDFQCVLYKCNVLAGWLKRLSGEAERDSNYLLNPPWETVREECYGLITEALFGHGIDADDELMRFGLQNNEAYIPISYDPQLEDRLEPVSGEYYIIESIKKRRFQSVALLEIREDTR